MTACDDSVEFVDDSDEEQSYDDDPARFAEAVIYGTDWTTETIVTQLQRENISLNPRFQRRDAWPVQRKSRFIESLILGLPIPQIVLAERREQRGKYIVLDGKQRLLSLMQFWGFGSGARNEYKLSGLQIKKKTLQRKKFSDLQTDPLLESDYTALINQPIRTVVIRNWPTLDFLDLVFVRLNTGSVPLSPQELRQALSPGPFADRADDMATDSRALKMLLNLTEPDYRMRDIELLVRFLAFSHFMDEYAGRMKSFLDTAYFRFNAEWTKYEPSVESCFVQFEQAIEAMIDVFGLNQVARKPGSQQLNKAIFDALIYYFQDPETREAARRSIEAVNSRYRSLFEDPVFVASVERDTAGVPNTSTRLTHIGKALEDATGRSLLIPSITDVGERKRITPPTIA